MDVDIDVPSNFDAMKVFPKWTRASVVRDGKLTPHPCGVYPQQISKDPISGLSAIPYSEAEELGFLKVDFLHVSAYNNFKSREEIETLSRLEPEWSLLQLPSTWPKLFQLSKHGDLLIAAKPNGIIEVADCMALIRPGKKTLIGLYTKNKEQARRALFAKDDTGYSFKKSHAYAYALVVKLQLHLISQGRL